MPEQTDVQVKLGNRAYDIAIRNDSMTGFSQFATRSMRTAFGDDVSLRTCVVFDNNVEEPHANRVLKSLAADGWNVSQIGLPPGEATKCQQTISNIYDHLVNHQTDRKTLIIAVGGGVTGDAAGFAAASFNRGIPFLQCPTTLLAHVDSSVGGKTGINHPQGKNLIGAFHQPIGVYIDISTLQTLPDREYRSGLAEVIKYGVILDSGFFEYLEQNIDGLNNRDTDVMRHIIAVSCQLKADVVENDEYETTGLRAVLNYGHTFAHAFEALSNYDQLLHGEAVAIGMVYASRLAGRLGRIPEAVTQRQIDLIAAVGLPTQLPQGMVLTVDDIMDRMKLDKKTVSGQLRFILPTQLGHVETVTDIPTGTVVQLLDDLLSPASHSDG
ncbi:3-dehydroquinate synthase [bacterium]|nr:3-dehydroquinate synthase [bacterium]